MASSFWFLLALQVIVAVSQRPNLTEWKASQQAEQDELAAVAARDKKMAAVDKAIDLLENLKTQILQEGEAEAATYNKFACFCKDTTSDKLASITAGGDEKAVLEASIGSRRSARDQLDTKIKNCVDAIKTLEDDMETADGERQATLKVFQSNDADLKAALDALTGAIQTLKASKGASLIEMVSISQTVRSALQLADALGINSKSGHVAGFLQETPENEVHMVDYKYHSDDIISTLEDLLGKFRSKHQDVEKDEVASIQTHDTLMQEKTHEKEVKTEELADARKEKSDVVSDLALESQRFSTVMSTLMEDQEYVNKLTKMCSDKAKTWDQRTRVRSDELSTLTEAIDTVRGAVRGNTTAKTVRFAQQKTSVRLAKIIASDRDAMDAIESEAEAVDNGSPQFFQTGFRLRGRGHALMAPEQHALGSDGRDEIVQLLNSEGHKLKSTLLTSLASKIAADPFAKIKNLIQELIERLLEEAETEANQKGWCDKSIADAKQKRKFAQKEIARVNSEMETLEGVRNKLAEELSSLSTDIAALNDARSEAEQNRAAEKQQNEATVLEAEAGLSALSECIQILDRFYKTIAKETVDLSLVQGPSSDAPSAGFENGEAYTGAQSEAGGILGMLDVMKSDFIRTVTETQKAEAEAEQDHLEFMTESGKSLAQKTEAESQKTEQKSVADGKYSQADSTLQQETTTVRQMITELITLKKTCIDTGMSYADRVANREDEIVSLRKAMCILGRYQEYGPDGAADGC